MKEFYANFLQAQKEMNGTAEPQHMAVPGAAPSADIVPPTPAEMAGDSAQIGK